MLITKLKQINVDPSEIEGIFITHTHTDHTDGLKVFKKKYNTKVYLTEKMYEDINKHINNYEIIGQELNLNDIKIITAVITFLHKLTVAAHKIKNINKIIVNVFIALSSNFDY